MHMKRGLVTNLIFIVSFGLLVGIITFSVASKKPDSFQAVQTYDLSMVNRPVTPDYQYGSYYGLKGAELMVQHIMSLLRSPAVIARIYDTAGLGYTIDHLGRFTTQFRTEQDSSQQVTVQFSRYTPEEADRLANAMSAVLTEEVKLAQQDSAGNSLFALRAQAPVVVLQQVDEWYVTVVGTIAGWLLGIILVAVKRYLSQ